MLHSIVGLQNCGKSEYASFLSFIDFLRGRKILSNTNLCFKHKRINKDFLTWLATKQPILRNVSFLLDECWLWYDAYQSMQERVGSYFFLQSSKDNSNIYMTAQNNEQNMRRIRNNLHRLSECYRVEKTKTGYKPILIEERDLSNYRTSENIPLNDVLFIKIINKKRVLDRYGSLDFEYHNTVYLKAKEYFKLYNTYEKRVLT